MVSRRARTSRGDGYNDSICLRLRGFLLSFLRLLFSCVTESVFVCACGRTVCHLGIGTGISKTCILVPIFPMLLREGCMFDRGTGTSHLSLGGLDFCFLVVFISTCLVTVTPQCSFF